MGFREWKDPKYLEGIDSKRGEKAGRVKWQLRCSPPRYLNCGVPPQKTFLRSVFVLSVGQ